MRTEFFIANRKKLRARVITGVPIVVAANGLVQRNGDVTFPFRQDSNFYYLTGINEPDLTLVIGETNEYLIVPARDKTRENFDGALDFKALVTVSGISEILDEKAGWQQLATSLAKTKSLATPAPLVSYEKRHGFYSNPARARLVRKLKRLAPNVEVSDIRKTLTEMRMIKQPEEIAAIQKAIDVTVSGIEEATSDLASFKYEYEIEASLTASFRSSGASGHSFQAIVASGKNACMLHNVANGGQLTNGELITLDVGAEVDNYAADITRTLALNGRPSVRQQQVYDAVLATQNYALGLLKPSASFKEYETAVANFLGQKLVELGLIASASDKIGIRKYCPHATSHFLGLDVHDVGDYRQPMAENMVVTCEPGIYIPEEGIGVRIEDDVLITANGNKVLSGHLPRKLTS